VTISENGIHGNLCKALTAICAKSNNSINFNFIEQDMKKIYLQPTTDVINIKSEQALLTGSLGIFNETVNSTDLLLAPELPNMSGVDLGVKLPGIDLPE
jgi:hypothetical protein